MWIVRLFLCLLCVSGFADDGLSFMQYRSSHGASVRVVRADLNQYRIMVLANQDYRLMSVKDFSRRHAGVVAAINGGFYQKNGRPSGFFKYHDWWSYSAKSRGVIGFSDVTDLQTIFFDRLRYESGSIRSTLGQSAWWSSVDYVVGGAPLLINNGHILDISEEQVRPSFARNRYARSGMCVDAEGQVLLVLVQGGSRWSHKLGYHKGLSLAGFAQEMRRLGCQRAINLDGGYSSSLIFKDKVIYGNPMQRLAPRAVANVIAIVPRDG